MYQIDTCRYWFSFHATSPFPHIPTTHWVKSGTLTQEKKGLHSSGSILLIPFLRLIKQWSWGLAFKIRASLSTTLVSAWVIKNVTGKTMNHVTKKLYGSGNCKIIIIASALPKQALHPIKGKMQPLPNSPGCLQSPTIIMSSSPKTWRKK